MKMTLPAPIHSLFQQLAGVFQPKDAGYYSSFRLSMLEQAEAEAAATAVPQTDMSQLVDNNYAAYALKYKPLDDSNLQLSLEIFNHQLHQPQSRLQDTSVPPAKNHVATIDIGVFSKNEGYQLVRHFDWIENPRLLSEIFADRKIETSLLDSLISNEEAGKIKFLTPDLRNVVYSQTPTAQFIYGR